MSACGTKRSLEAASMYARKPSYYWPRRVTPDYRRDGGDRRVPRQQFRRPASIGSNRGCAALRPSKTKSINRQIEGNCGRPQHPQRDHRNQDVGIVADADADIRSRLDAAQPQLAHRLCRSGGKPGIGERQPRRDQRRSLWLAMRQANEGISQVHRIRTTLHARTSVFLASVYDTRQKLPPVAEI